MTRALFSALSIGSFESANSLFSCKILITYRNRKREDILKRECFRTVAMERARNKRNVKNRTILDEKWLFTFRVALSGDSIFSFVCINIVDWVLIFFSPSELYFLFCRHFSFYVSMSIRKGKEWTSKFLYQSIVSVPSLSKMTVIKW